MGEISAGNKDLEFMHLMLKLSQKEIRSIEILVTDGCRNEVKESLLCFPASIVALSAIDREVHLMFQKFPPFSHEFCAL